MHVCGRIEGIDITPYTDEVNVCGGRYDSDMMCNISVGILCVSMCKYHHYQRMQIVILQYNSLFYATCYASRNSLDPAVSVPKLRFLGPKNLRSHMRHWRNARLGGVLLSGNVVDQWTQALLVPYHIFFKKLGFRKAKQIGFLAFT